MQSPEESPRAAAGYAESEAAWRQQVEASLRGEESWLALVGLFWLQDGKQAAGSDPGLPIAFPLGAAPVQAGTFYVQDGHVHYIAAKGATAKVEGRQVERVTLELDSTGHPTHLQIGRLRMIALRRGARLGLRVWDPASPRRSAFPPRTWFPPDPDWRIPGTYAAYDPPRPARIANVLGDIEDDAFPGEVILDHNGHVAHLQVYSGNEHGLFLAFQDTTNRSETYPAGRYLRTSPPIGGQVVLDFNRATNPPCAFTPFATCSLPPEGNSLPYHVTAGEQYRMSNSDGAPD